MRRPCRNLLLTLLLVTGCPKPTVPPPVTDDACAETLVDAVGNQSTYVIAVRPLVATRLFAPAWLHTVDDLTRVLEQAETGHEMEVRSLTTMPLIRSTGRGADLVTVRDELPLDDAGAAEFRALFDSLEFLVGDLVNVGQTACFIHLPVVNYVGVDVDALVEELRPQFTQAMLAVDGTAHADRSIYKDVAGRGPSADRVLISYTADGESVKTPAFLVAMHGFQERVEALTGVAGSYSLADDVMLTRRVVHKGDPGAYLLPPKQAEINQLLMMYEMSGAPDEYGIRITDDRELTVVQVTLSVLEEGPRNRLLAQIHQFAGEGFPPEVHSQLCLP